jgi:hypothetical protein
MVLTAAALFLSLVIRDNTNKLFVKWHNIEF